MPSLKTLIFWPLLTKFGQTRLFLKNWGLSLFSLHERKISTDVHHIYIDSNQNKTNKLSWGLSRCNAPSCLVWLHFLLPDSLTSQLLFFIYSDWTCSHSVCNWWRTLFSHVVTVILGIIFIVLLHIWAGLVLLTILPTVWVY